MTIARLKIDIAENLKKGTELVQYGNVFCNDKTCFTADLVYGSPHFDVIDNSLNGIENPANQIVNVTN